MLPNYVLLGFGPGHHIDDLCYILCYIYRLINQIILLTAFEGFEAK